MMKKIVLDIQSDIHAHTMDCRVILFVDDDTDGELTEKVRRASARV